MLRFKTCRAAAKRFKKPVPKDHGETSLQEPYLNKKSQKRKRNLRKATVVDSTNLKNVRKSLPYL